MELYGLPDFDRPIQGEGFQLLYPFGGGDMTVLPQDLELAKNADGSPDFALELVRHLGRFSAADTYGLVDLRVCPRDQTAAALALARAERPSAMVRPAGFAAGFARFQLLQLPGADHIELPPPQPLAANSLGATRALLQVSPALAALLKGALAGELLALTLVAELALLGVSPRLPVEVRFNPAELLAPLLAQADRDRRIARDTVVALFRQGLAGLPIELAGELPGEQADTFAQALADRVLHRFGTFAAAPSEPVRPSFALPAPDQIAAGRFEWNLAEPIAVLRPIVLALDPLLAARELVRERGLAAVYRETSVPAFPTGVLPVTVLGNLPDTRPGVLEIGVTLSAPPQPPARPQGVVATAALEPPDDRATLGLALGVGAAADFSCSTYVVLIQDNGVNRLETPERPHSGSWLSLSPGDFPTDFVLVEADHALLDLAALQGTLAWQDGMSQGSIGFALDRGCAAVALALPRGAAGATITVAASAPQAGRTLRLGPLPAEHLRLGLYSFAEYGPHTLQAMCSFDDASRLCAIELLPEGGPEDSIALLVFTPAQTAKSWVWFAQNPFAPGYRFRPRREEGTLVAPWSEIHSPFEPLTLRSSELANLSSIAGATT